MTFGVLLLGRLSPGPAAVPYRHDNAQSAQQTTPTPIVGTVTVGFDNTNAQAAFTRPANLAWQSDWTRAAADKAMALLNLHVKNAPVELIRDAQWTMDVAPALLRGGGAALTIKIVY